MPKDKQDRIVCVTHTDVPMGRIPGFHALTKVNKNKSKVSFMPSSGIPVVAFACNICGYIETYSAVKTDEWSNVRLYVKCKTCGNDFISPVQMNEDGFHSSKITNNSYQCLFCGKMDTYNKEDHFFK
ncbi:hypothetical protein KKG19_05310 [Patescibacteria group bacterium]|nr:hypothetical protein [Patescibacteria group bacterium]